MKRALPVIALVLLGLLALAVWSESGEAGVETVPLESAGAIGEVPAATSGHGNESENENDAAAASTEQSEVGSAEDREVVALESPTANLAVLKGRCVDADGTAVEGVNVRIHGWGANRERMNTHRKAHGEVDWTDPEPTVTGPDGRFEVAFTPPPPYQFTIDLNRQGLLRMAGRWHELSPGTVKDFGDVRMFGGCRVHGRLEDTKSRPLGPVTISINPFNTARRARRAEIYQRDYLQCRTAADGSFEFQNVVPPGEYRLGVGREEIVSPEKLVVPTVQPDCFVMIVVKSAADVPTIEGIVVDEGGKPISRVDIESRATGSSYRVSRRDGTFSVRRGKRDTGAPVRLLFRRDGFEDAETGKPLEWGAKDIRVVMKRGLDVQIQVTDADTHQPIEDYSIIAMPAPGQWRRSSSRDRRPRNRGHHDNGITVLRGLRRGAYLVLVDPSGKEWLHSGFHEFLVGDRGPNRLDIVLRRGVPRTVRVETTLGSPVAGTRLELLRQIGSKPVTFETWVLKLHGSSHSSSWDLALFYADGETNGEGEIVFTAPPGSDYAVRAHGPGHRPHVESGVEFAADAAPLILRVPVGARLFGKVRPPRLLRQLREESKETARNGKWGVGFRLERANPAGRRQSLPTADAARFSIGEDGSFEITGVPPGTWKMRLHWRLNEREFVGEVRDLKDGESRQMNLDLARMLLASVHGRVTLNAKPAVGSILTLRTNATENDRWRNFRLDAEGRYRAMLVPDTFVAILQHKVGERRHVMLPADSPLVVAPEQEIEHDFTFHCGELRIVVVGADGKPRQRVRVHASDSTGDWRTVLPLTDESGKAKTVTKPAGLHLHVWPKRLMDSKEQRAFLAKHRGDPGAWKRQRIKVGEATVSAGGDTEIRVQLPASAGY